jgi:acyl-CoA hydrolase
MIITMQNTTKVVEFNGVPARVWEGETDKGVKVHCYVTRVAVDENERPDILTDFQRELKECNKPSAEVESIPARMVL